MLVNSKKWRGSDVITQKGCYNGMPRSEARAVRLCFSFIYQSLTLIFVGAVWRVLCVLQAMAAINPRQAEHLKKLQPQFRFKERRIGSPPAALNTEPLLPTDLNLASKSTEYVKLHDCYVINISSIQTSYLISSHLILSLLCH
jgi:hypothetical protein